MYFLDDSGIEDCGNNKMTIQTEPNIIIPQPEMYREEKDEENKIFPVEDSFGPKLPQESIDYSFPSFPDVPEIEEIKEDVKGELWLNNKYYH